VPALTTVRLWRNKASRLVAGACQNGAVNLRRAPRWICSASTERWGCLVCGGQLPSQVREAVQLARQPALVDGCLQDAETLRTHRGSSAPRHRSCRRDRRMLARAQHASEHGRGLKMELVSGSAGSAGKMLHRPEAQLVKQSRPCLRRGRRAPEPGRQRRLDASFSSWAVAKRRSTALCQALAGLSFDGRRRRWVFVAGQVCADRVEGAGRRFFRKRALVRSCVGPGDRDSRSNRVP